MFAPCVTEVSLLLRFFLVTPQVFGHITEEGRGGEKRDGKPLPRFHGRGVDRGTRQPCNGSTKVYYRSYPGLRKGIGAVKDSEFFSVSILDISSKHDDSSSV